MPELNLAAVRRHSRELCDLNNELIAFHKGSDRNALKVSQTNILQLISRKKEQEIDTKKDDENKRILIAMLRYFPLSEQKDTPDYVDFLEEYFPEILYEYCLHEKESDIPHPLNASEYVAAKNLGPNNRAPNTAAQILTRLNRLLQKEPFVNGLFHHYNERTLSGSPALIIDLEKMPEPLVKRYTAQNAKEQKYFLNRHPMIGQLLKPLFARLPYALFSFFYGDTNQTLVSLLCRTSAKKPEVLAVAPAPSYSDVASPAPAAAPSYSGAAPAAVASYLDVASKLGTPRKAAEGAPDASSSPLPSSSQYQAMPPVHPSSPERVIVMTVGEKKRDYSPIQFRADSLPPGLNNPAYSPIPAPPGGFQMQQNSGTARTLTFEVQEVPKGTMSGVEQDDKSIHTAVTINP